MTFSLNRRRFAQLGALGLGALSAPLAARLGAERGFTHGVASGEPRQRSVLLWTRYAAGASDTTLAVEMSDRADFSNRRTVGEAAALADRDSIAKITVDGLEPGRWYFYRFVAPDGTLSLTGRTRTLPEGATARFALGVFSCSNMPFGYFNAYAHAAERRDLDLVVHTGDYLYEYPRGSYPSPEQALAARIVDPAGETIALTDYRLRYASYRRDPDLQRLHQNFPMIAMWDDHEFTNDAFETGAQNHQPETEGDWNARKIAAERAYREWMPVRDLAPGATRWTDYQIGDLATLFVTESRITARDEPVALAAALAGGGDRAAALRAFRDDVWMDPAREKLGAAQQAWLATAMARSVGAGTRWQVWSQQTIIGELRLPQAAASWVSADTDPRARAVVEVGTQAAKLGLPLNYDAWDGYPMARRRALTGALEADANLIVLTGDSHNAWSFNLGVDNMPAGVEFAGQSVTSPGFEAYTAGVDPAAVAAALRADNPALGYTDTSQRGYMRVELTPDAATSNWEFLDTIRARSTAMRGRETRRVAHGSNRLAS